MMYLVAVDSFELVCLSFLSEDRKSCLGDAYISVLFELNRFCGNLKTSNFVRIIGVLIGVVSFNDSYYHYVAFTPAEKVGKCCVHNRLSSQ